MLCICSLGKGSGINKSRKQVKLGAEIELNCLLVDSHFKIYREAKPRVTRQVKLRDSASGVVLTTRLPASVSPRHPRVSSH